MTTTKITNIYMKNISWSRIRASGAWLLFNNMSDYVKGQSRYQPLTAYNIEVKNQVVIDEFGGNGYLYDSNIAYSKLVSYSPKYLYNVSMYNLTSKKNMEIISEPYKCSAPLISGNTIVWADNSGNNSSIYKFDISTKQIERVTWQENAYDPNVYDNHLVWFEQDSRKNWSIVTLDMTDRISTKQRLEKREFDVPDPMIFGDNVIWDSGFQHLYVYNSQYNTTKRLNDFFLTSSYYDIWKDFIVLTGHYENDSVLSRSNIFLIQFQWKEQVIESTPVPHKEDKFDLAPVVVSIIIMGLSASIIIYLIKHKRRIGTIHFHENLDKSNIK